MIALIQRVSRARIAIDGADTARIGVGLVALVCAERGDGTGQIDALARKLVGYRVFADGRGRMNLSVRDVSGDLLLVPQFTLAADTTSGSRPGFSRAAPPEQGKDLFDRFVERVRGEHPKVECGCFGAHMQVELVNDGPVTFWLQAGAGQEAAQ